MHDSIAVTRTGLNMALAYCLPLLVWLLGQSMLVSTDQADPTDSLRTFFPTLLLLQACMLGLCLPWILRSPSRTGHCAAVFLLVTVPLPLYAITWLAGAASAASLFLALLSLFALGGLLYGLYSACLAYTRAGHLRSLLFLTLQLLALLSCWYYRAEWQRLLGL
jgi:hypothetical protein